ncbi:DEKNAAC104158 [Brettanomyces naardenensis]|uniref:DEKNAAC104158 n=1 Tax=Brettanomyces naardenensis TaxID=13370 RepID=A0A448YQ50_BRENA|nr:DEKNAAC104158 [Brettanomyces naardenensis]
MSNGARSPTLERRSLAALSDIKEREEAKARGIQSELTSEAINEATNEPAQQGAVDGLKLVGSDEVKTEAGFKEPTEPKDVPKKPNETKETEETEETGYQVQPKAELHTGAIQQSVAAQSSASNPPLPTHSPQLKPFKVSHQPKELISTMTYDGEGTLLDDGASSSSGESDNHVENEKNAVKIEERSDVSEEEELEVEDGRGTITMDTILQSGNFEPTSTELEELGEDGETEAATVETEKLNEDESPSSAPPSEQGTSIVPLPASSKGEDSSSSAAAAAVPTPSVPHRSSLSLKVPNPPADSKPQGAFDFQQFLEQFKSKECQPIHRYLRSFLSQFSQRNWTIDEQVKLIKDFEVFLLGKMTEYFPFNTLQTEEEINNCKEGLEKLILTRLYLQVFSPAVAPKKLSEQHRKDRAHDREYAKNVRLYGWVQLRHLDVPMDLDLHSSFMQLASNELNKINDYKSPRDKVICILNCCKIIFGFIRQQQKQHHIEENADSFVPLLICVLFQAKTRLLYSNLVYIERYRNEDFLVGETSYYVSTLQIACNFVIDLDKDQLTISDEEFERSMAISREELQREREKRKQERAGRGSPLPKKLTDFISQTSSESPSEVLTKSAEMMKQSLSNFFQTGNEESTEAPAPHHSSHKYRALAATEEQLQEIERLSLEEHNQEVENRNKQQKNIENLQSMFPDIDREIIDDVLGTTLNGDGSNIGECVDALLALGG